MEYDAGGPIVWPELSADELREMDDDARWDEADVAAEEADFQAADRKAHGYVGEMECWDSTADDVTQPTVVPDDIDRQEFQDFFDDYLLERDECRDDEGYGDPRRCPRHPHVKTSSDDGMFDAPCGECEYEIDAEYARREETTDDPVVAERMGHPVHLSEIDDDVPF